MTDSKLIMKNTGFMAVRMLLSMAVSLYTSRVVLQQLGVTDFGIFTVIGGLAIIMSFFTSALSAAIQRYMSVELAVSKGIDPLAPLGESGTLKEIAEQIGAIDAARFLTELKAGS